MTLSVAKQQILGMLSAALGGIVLTTGGALSQYQRGSIAQLLFCMRIFSQTHVNSSQLLGTIAFSLFVFHFNIFIFLCPHSTIYSAINACNYMVVIQ